MPSIRRTRRDLLKAALAAAPWFIPSAALGRGRFVAPSERITLGLIGLKKMGGAHLESLLRYPRVQIVAVCDVDARARETAQRKAAAYYSSERGDDRFESCAAYNEYERILERPDVDAVLIAVPDHWHAAIAIAACRAGKDVYCEKPLSLTIRQAQRMVAAARRYGTVFQTGTQQRSMANFRFACELVRNRRIGELKSVHVDCGPPSTVLELPEMPVPDGLDYDRWLGPAPWAPYHPLRVGSNYWDGWRRWRDYSGGKMTDWGAHHFDIVQWGLGADETGPVEILPPPHANDWQRERRWFAGRHFEGAGAWTGEPTHGLTYRYANGVEVIKDGGNGVRFVGSEGWVEVNRGYLKTEPASLARSSLGPNDLHLRVSDNHYDDWLDCIRSRGRPIADVAIAARSATVCHLGALACWLERPLRWDPQRWEFDADSEAARWLDRPQRAPYGGPEA